VIDLLLSNPLILLFTVIAVGYPLGRIRIAGVSLGVAAVLFTGLAVGALHPEMKLPELVYQLGLVLFVYTVGLSNGPGFFASFRRRGLRDNLFVALVLVFAALLSILVGRLFHLRPTLAAGVFAGSLTNTPALAALLEVIKSTWRQGDLGVALADPVVGYSVTYPVGVVGMIVALALAAKIWRVNYAAEAQQMRSLGGSVRQLSSATLRVTRTAATGRAVSDLRHTQNWDVAFGRLERDESAELVTGETVFSLGDLVTVVGTPEDLRLQPEGDWPAAARPRPGPSLRRRGDTVAARRRGVRAARRHGARARRPRAGAHASRHPAGGERLLWRFLSGPERD
jgi:putative transport protein